MNRSLLPAILAIVAILVSPSAAQVPDHYVVVLSNDVASPRATVAEIVRQNSLDARHVYSHALKGFSAVIPAVRLEAVRTDPRVAYVEPDLDVHAVAQVLPTGVDRIDVDTNPVANIDGVDDRVDADVAVLDTGVDEDHPDLNVFMGQNFSNGPSWKWGDGNGHGSHVAGTVGALDNDIGVVGVAPGARIWAGRVLRDDGSGFLSDVIAGVDWVTQNADQIEVVNMSLSATGSSNAFRTAIQNSVAAGVVYVVAASNSSKDVYGNDGVFDTNDDVIPAAYREVAAVAALADGDGQAGGLGGNTSYGPDDSFATFSNYSASVAAGNPVNSPGAAIDLLLPGVDIYSTYRDGGYATASGTSMASPHGAGLAALLFATLGTRDVNGDGNVNALDVYALRQLLIDTGQDQNGPLGLATQNDPDSNAERIGWAGVVSGDPPSVSWTSPSDGATHAGSVPLQISASDTEDAAGALTVEYRVDGGAWTAAAYNAVSGYYEAAWDTTTAADGDHGLDARASDGDGNTAVDSITVTTENTDDAPAVAWVNPTDGATVKDTVTIQVDASDDRDAAGSLVVEWRVDGGAWVAAVYNAVSGYYEAAWDTTTLADGNHTVDARARDSLGNESAIASAGVTVANTTGGGDDMYVADISFAQKDFGRGGTSHDLIVTVTIRQDSDGNGVADPTDALVAGAGVSMTLSHGSDAWFFGATTGESGQVTFTLKFAPPGEYQAQVTNVTHGTLSWNSLLDAENVDSYVLQ